MVGIARWDAASRVKPRIFKEREDVGQSRLHFRLSPHWLLYEHNPELTGVVTISPRLRLSEEIP